MRIQDLYQQREQFFLELSPTTRGCLIFMVVVGVLSFGFGMVLGEQTRTWGSFLFNAFFFFSIAVGGVAFGHMQDVLGAKWGRPIKRIHESFGAFIPVAVVLFTIFFLCIRLNILHAGLVYPWMADPTMVEHFFGKNFWLRPNFMLVRDFLCLLGILGLSRWHFKLTTAADYAVLAGEFSDAERYGQHATKILRYWSAPVMVIYSVLFSILAFDLTMSLAPLWQSTLWAGWSFAVMMQTLLASLLLALFYFSKKPLGQLFKRQQFHDVGKLLFAFTAFYAYLTYAHVLTYWYTNVPEETSYFITRLQKPWLKFIIAAPFISFLIPFVALVPKASKWTSFVAIPVCVLVLVAQWINALVVVIPEVTKAGTWSWPWIELGLLCGFLGAFLLSFSHAASKVPLLSIGDPLLLEALSAEH